MLAFGGLFTLKTGECSAFCAWSTCKGRLDSPPSARNRLCVWGQVPWGTIFLVQAINLQCRLSIHSESRNSTNYLCKKIKPKTPSWRTRFFQHTGSQKKRWQIRSSHLCWLFLSVLETTPWNFLCTGPNSQPLRYFTRLEMSYDNVL